MERLRVSALNATTSKPIGDFPGQRGITQSALRDASPLDPILARYLSRDEVAPGISRICTTISLDGIMTVAVREKGPEQLKERELLRDAYKLIASAARDIKPSLNVEAYASIRGNRISDIYCLNGLIVEPMVLMVTFNRTERIMEFGLTGMTDSRGLETATSVTLGCVKAISAGYEKYRDG